MPKDEWRRETERIAARKREVGRSGAPRTKRLPSARVIPVGSQVMIRKKGDESVFRSYKTKTLIRFERFLAASKAAFLVEHLGYELWVAKRLLTKE